MEIVPAPFVLREVDLRFALPFVLSTVLSEVRNREIDTGDEIDDDGVLQVLSKGIKQRKESAEAFRKGGRDELADKEEREAAVLETYLPPAVDEGELETAIREMVAERGLEGPAGIGPVMKEMMARYAGRADGAAIRTMMARLMAISERSASSR